MCRVQCFTLMPKLGFESMARGYSPIDLSSLPDRAGNVDRLSAIG
ncbi:hypothetical protein QUB19_09325 [Microcoleus sp. B4-C5]